MAPRGAEQSLGIQVPAGQPRMNSSTVEHSVVNGKAAGSSPASSAANCKTYIRQRGKRKSVSCFANKPRRVDRVVMCQPAKLGLPFIRYSRSIRLPSAWCLGRDGFHCAGLKSQRSWFDSTGHRKKHQSEQHLTPLWKHYSGRSLRRVATYMGVVQLAA